MVNYLNSFLSAY